MNSSSEGIAEDSRRSLRQRTAQPPYRPRPQLTSSDRGKAGAELRRQRELEANLVFSEANELIQNVKNIASSYSCGLSEAEADSAMEEEIEGILSSQVADVNLLLESEEQASQDVAQAEAPSIGLSSPPPAKKSRLEEEDDEFDDGDDVFFEQLVAADAVDWDNGSQSRPRADVSTDSQVVVNEDAEEYVQKNREAFPETDGFRWSNDREVRLAQKAIENGRKILEKIKQETERMDLPIGDDSISPEDSIYEAPRPPPSRPILAPLSSSTINRRLGSARMPSSIQSVRDGKRKLQEEVEVSEAPSTPFRPSSSLMGTPDQRPVMGLTGSPLPRTPIPARSTLRLGTTLRTSTPIQTTPATSTPRPVFRGLPQTPRVALGMTPRRSTSNSVPRFKTPFKDISHLQQTPSSSQRSPDLFKIPAASRGASSPIVTSLASVTRQVTAQPPQTIFNLDKTPVGRTTFHLMGYEPEGTSAVDARNHLPFEVYDAIVQILNQPTRSLKYAFGVEATYLGREGIHTMLIAEAGQHQEIPRAWIDNHYVLILWKLAAYTRHALDDRYWQWDEVCRQFKYRFEREFNRNHRSCVKRIMREDCPSTRSMVLCVYQIPPYNPLEGEDPVIVLTDGWYKIKAVVDSVLCLAIYGVKPMGRQETKTPTKSIKRSEAVVSPHKEGNGLSTVSSASKCQQNGKEVEEEGLKGQPLPSTVMVPEKIRIKVGTKLAIQGARLDSDCDSSDPLRAFEQVRLILGGNSTKLATWQAKLGFTRGSFIGTVRSLSGEGGNVPLMDLVITRLYPIAYCGDECCPGYQSKDSGYLPEWSQEEEDERRQAWEKHREKAIHEIQKGHEEETQELRSICEELEAAYESLSHDGFDNGIDTSACEDMLDAIVTAGTASAYVNMTHIVPKLRELACKRLKATREKMQAELEKVILARVGSRKTRSFRFVRCRDAGPQDYGREGSVSSKRQQCQRDVLLKIWDYTARIERGCDVAQREGEHFMVTNLTPTRVKGWPSTDGYGEIELTSGKNSIWRMVRPVSKLEGK